MAVTFAGCGLQAGASATSPISTLTTSSSLAVGDFLVVLIAYDNSGGGGSDPMTGQISATPATGALGASVSAQTGINDPGAASAGLAVRCVCFPVTTAIPSGTAVSVSWSSGSIVRYLLLFLKVSSAGVTGYRTNSGATGTNQVNVTAPALTTPSVNSGEAVLCWCGYEYGSGASITADADTTNGTWTAVPGTLYSGSSGSALTGMAAAFQAKVVTATATQAWNPTGGVASDWILGCLIFTETAPPVALVVDDAAHTLTSDNVTVEHVLPTVLDVQDCFHAHVSQQPAEHYLDATVGQASTPDTPDMTLQNVHGWIWKATPPTAMPAALATQGDVSGNYSWSLSRQTDVGNNWYLLRSDLGTSYSGLVWPLSGARPIGLAQYLAYFNILNDGSNNNNRRSYQSFNEGVTWTQEGNVNGVSGAIFDSAGPVVIGKRSNATWPASNWDGRIHWIEFRQGGVHTDPTSGTVVWRFDAADHVSGTSWVGAVDGRTWTLTNASAVVHQPAAADVTIIHVPATELVVQNCQHNFVNQTDLNKFLVPSVSRASTPDPGPLPTDGFVFVYKTRGPQGTGSGSQTIVSQNKTNSASFRFNRRASDGVMFVLAYPAGTTSTQIFSGSPVPGQPQTDQVNPEYYATSWVGSTRSYKVMRSTNGGVSYTDTVTGTGTAAAFFDSSDPVWIGADNVGATSIWNDFIYSIELRTGIDPLGGTLLWKFDANEHVSGTSWVDARSRTWTLTDAAAIVTPSTNTPVIEHVVPIVITPDDCFHTVVSHQPHGKFLNGQLGVAYTADVAIPASDLILVMKINGPPSSVAGASRYLVGQGVTPNISYHLSRTYNLTWLSWAVSTDGNVTGAKLAVSGVSGRSDEWIALTYPASTAGAALWRSNDQGASWAVETTGSTGTNRAFFDSASNIVVGSQGSTSIGGTNWEGRIYWLEMRTGNDPTGGTLLWRFDASEYPGSGTSYVDPRGRTWTLTASAAGLQTVAPSDVTIQHIPSVTLVVQNAQHAFVVETDFAPFLVPNTGRASTPDPGPLLTTGFVFVMKIRGPQNLTAFTYTLASQNYGSPNSSFRFSIAGGIYGQMTLLAYPDGSASVSAVSSSATVGNPTRTAADFIALSCIASTGAWMTYRSADGGGTYAQVTPGTGVVTSFFDSADPLWIGGDGVQGITNRFDDRIYWIELRTGTDPKAGTVLWRFDASEWVSGTAWTDARGRTWTLTSATAIQVPTPDIPTIEVQVAPTLANLDAYHTVDSGTPALTQVHVLAVDNATHAQIADSPAFTQAHVLVVANAAHTEVSDSPGLTQVHILTVAGAAHAQAVDHVAINTATNVPPADAAHAIISDSPAITQVHVLVVANAAHAMTSDAPAFTQVHVLTVAGAAQAHTAATPAITQVHILVVDSAVHAHSADNVGITQVHLITVQSAAHTTFSPELGLSTEGVVAGADTYHSVTSSTPTLTQVHNLVVQNALHVHLADSVSIVYNVNLPAVASAVHAHVASNVALIVDIPVHSALHAHTADHVPITVRSDLVVASAAHAQTASNVTITQVHVFVVADAVHAQATSGVTLTQVHILAVQSALHVHSADNIDFTQVHFLAAVANAFHAHSADEDLPVTQEHYLTVASALHEHTVDEFAIDYIVWLDVDDAHHALLGPEVNLAGIVTLNEALALYLGSRAVQAVYLGTSKVWP